MEAELAKALRQQNIKCSDTIMVKQLETAATSHGLTARDIASKMSAYLIDRQAFNRPLAAATVDQFVASLHRECNKENQAARGGATPGAKWNSGREWGGLADTLGSGLKPDQAALATATPAKAAAAGKASPATPQSVPRSAFKTRTNRGQLVSTLNSHIPQATGEQVAVVHAEPQGPQLPGRHLYLQERLEDKVAAVNSRIASCKRWFSSALAAAAAAAGAAGAEPGAAAAAAALEFAPVGVPVQEESYFVGRVVCEVEGGHLNDTAVVLEGDSSSSDGARVALDLSALPSYRLFPGQVIAVRGFNPSGARILARALWTHLPPPPPASSLGAAAMEIDGCASGLGGSGGLSAVVAAGPFCLAEDLAYDPLHELLQDLKANPPSLLVLLGPFVDCEQPLISSGMINITFGALFQTQVFERLQAWQAALPAPCQVMLMPAVRDAFHHPTFPQPAFNLPPDQHLVSLQNPCSFSAGPALFSATTTDVLRHLSSVELAKAGPGAAADRLAALASHVIGQRRVYPLYPPPPGTCLDLTGDTILQLQQLPDLLLLPSDLAPFAKLVAAAPATAAGGGYSPTPAAGVEGEGREVVVINPGRVAKGSSGGTYARISVAEGSGALSGRCRVDIMRV